MPVKGSLKSHCVHGHVRTPENVDIRRACKLCAKKRIHVLGPEMKVARHARLIVNKIQVLSHYGNNGVLGCRWPGCRETDLDVLTLDHIANDGYKDRNGNKGASKLYARLIRERFPLGFQTLCANHQLKKELMRRRSLWEVPTHVEQRAA